MRRESLPTGWSQIPAINDVPINVTNSELLMPIFFCAPINQASNPGSFLYYEIKIISVTSGHDNGSVAIFINLKSQASV